MLVEMDEEIDGAISGMAMTTKRTQEFIHQHGGMKWCCVVLVLAGILAFLVLVVLFT
jgi:hypothetical protein